MKYSIHVSVLKVTQFFGIVCVYHSAVVRKPKGKVHPNLEVFQLNPDEVPATIYIEDHQIK